MNENEKLLLETYEKLKLYFEPVMKQPQKPWKPEIGDNYITISHEGKILYRVWGNNDVDKYLHAIGNCYPYTDEGKELAIWEQVTRRKYEQALWDAADWVSGGAWLGFYDTFHKKIMASKMADYVCASLPLFATEQSCLEAHTRILGDDAEIYFRVR